MTKTTTRKRPPPTYEAAIATLTEYLDVWEVPVCASDLAKAYPAHSKYTYARALKMMADAGVMYASPGERDRMYYIPVNKRPMCAVQEYLCRGRLFI